MSENEELALKVLTDYLVAIRAETDVAIERIKKAKGLTTTVQEDKTKPKSSKKQSVEDIKMMFPEDLENLLSFEQKTDYVLIKPRQFLGSDNFAKIAAIIREARGEYVSAGKESHFRVP